MEEDQEEERPEQTFNCTIAELKYNYKTDEKNHILSFNCTIAELKYNAAQSITDNAGF